MASGKRSVSAFVRRPFVREFSWLAASAQASAILSMLTTLVLARTVSLAEVGQVAFAQALAALLVLVLDIRFEDAVQRYVPLLRRESEDRARSLFWRLFRWDVVLGLGVAVIAIAAWAVGAYPENDLSRPALLALAISSAGVGSSVGTLNAGFAVSGGLGRLGRTNIVGSSLTAVATVAGVLSFGAVGYLVGAVCGSAVQVVVRLPYCLRHLRTHGVRSSAKVDRSLPAGFVRFLVSSTLATSLAIGSESGMLVVSGLGGGADLVAILKIAGAPGRVLQSVFSPIGTQVFPRLAALAAAFDREGVRRLTARTTRALVFPVASVVAVSVPLMRPAVTALYGGQYDQAASVAILFLLAGALRALVIWSKVLPSAVGRPEVRLVALAAESAVVLTGAYLLSTSTSAVDDAGMGIGTVAVTVAAALAVFWTWMSRRPDLVRAA